MSLIEKIGEIQKEIGVLKKNKKNPFFKSEYLDLNQINENLNPLLEKHNLVITQPITNVDGRPALSLRVTDLDNGEFINEIATLPDLQDAQKMGGAVTYFRRYTLVALFRIDAEDDDGNTASGNLKVKSYEKAEDRKKREAKNKADYDNGKAPF
jgi:hypothetical protein